MSAEEPGGSQGPQLLDRAVPLLAEISVGVAAAEGGMTDLDDGQSRPLALAGLHAAAEQVAALHVDLLFALAVLDEDHLQQVEHELAQHAGTSTVRSGMLAELSARRLDQLVRRVQVLCDELVTRRSRLVGD